MSDERQMPGTKDDRGPNERALWRRDLILVAAFVIGLVGFYAYNEHQQEVHDDQIRMENRDAILDGIEANCLADRRFRIQYKRRGALEIALVELFIGLSREVIQTGIPPDQVEPSRDFIRRFQPLLDRIEILPIPDCAEQREQIEEALSP